MKIKDLLKLSYYSILLILTIIYIFYRIFFTIPTTLGTLSLVFAIIVLLSSCSHNKTVFEVLIFSIAYDFVEVDNTHCPESSPLINTL